ncbi:MAG: hypothetical protein PHV56_08155, partial [Clostridia bacterium]|nr:hypothetical protein [Clostridia bacterium]
VKAGRTAAKTAKKSASSSFKIGKAGALRAARAPVKATKKVTEATIQLGSKAVPIPAVQVAVKVASKAIEAVKKIVKGTADLAEKARNAVLKGALVLTAVFGPLLLFIATMFLVASAVLSIFPSTFILAEKDHCLEYRDRVRELDAAFEQRIEDEKTTSEAKTKDACKTTFSYYNAGVYVLYHNIAPANNQIVTDWQGVMALAAVIYDQNLTFSAAEQNLIAKVHGELNTMVAVDEQVACPDGGDCAPYWVSCPTPPTYRCKVTCCPGHLKRNINVYIYEVDEEIPEPAPPRSTLDKNLLEEAERRGILTDAAKEFFRADRHKWWDDIMVYDLNELHPNIHTEPKP